MLFITTVVLVGGKQVTSLITNPYKIIQQPFYFYLNQKANSQSSFHCRKATVTAVELEHNIAAVLCLVTDL